MNMYGAKIGIGKFKAEFNVPSYIKLRVVATFLGNNEYPYK